MTLKFSKILSLSDIEDSPTGLIGGNLRLCTHKGKKFFMLSWDLLKPDHLNNTYFEDFALNRSRLLAGQYFSEAWRSHFIWVRDQQKNYPNGLAKKDRQIQWSLYGKIVYVWTEPCLKIL